MGKKYIIEMEDKMFHKTGESGAVLWRAKGFNSLVFDMTGIDKLTPYTEPDLDHVRKEAYDNGYHDGCNACYETAKDLMEKKKDEAYKRGLADAWEAARKIHRMPDGDILDLFPDCYASVCTAAQPILKYDASEAIAKIKEYEDGKQEIKVGDEVKTEDGQKMVIAALINKDFAGLGDDGRFMFGELDETITRTGRHFPEIASVLEKMRGEKE